MSKRAWGIILGFGSICTIIAGVWIALNVFCQEQDSLKRFDTAKAVAKELTQQVTSEINELAGYTRKGFRDIQLSRYQDELRKLGRVYGTTDCDRIPNPADAEYCRWIKDQIIKLRAG